ncbi:DUF6350 family protein [Amycolatopsis nigrescens]|uniref:cell division protein PerM n=1 Tax=Amycolatopsis nigrescens TaxID=381445 RepID=UPI000376B147|nr:DUF6350 family protein [Amycolatopsis nigrescens]
MPLLTTSVRSGGDERLPESEPPEELTGAGRFRVLAAAALVPMITGYALVATLLALVTATGSPAAFSALGALAVAGPAWLATYQVPVEILGQPLGVLPLLATIGVFVLLARSANGAAQRLGYRRPQEAVPLVGVMAGAHMVAGATISLTGDEQFGVDPLTAFLVPGLFAALAATAGAASKAGLAELLGGYLDPVAVRGLRAGVLGLAGLLACGALVFTLSLALSTPTMVKLFELNAPGVGGGLGMVLLSVGYLPNAVLFGLAFAAGPGFSIGAVSLDPLGFQGGPVPGLPMLAGMPEQYAPWWPALMVLPAAAGALVGWSLRRIHPDPMLRLRTVGVAGAVVGFGCVVLGTLAGGRLGAGMFDPVAIRVGMFSVTAFCWIVIPGGMVAWLAGPHGETEPEAEPVEEHAESVVSSEAVVSTEDAEDPEAGEPEESTEDSAEAEDLVDAENLVDGEAAEPLADEEPVGEEPVEPEQAAEDVEVPVEEPEPETGDPLPPEPGPPPAAGGATERD